MIELTTIKKTTIMFINSCPDSVEAYQEMRGLYGVKETDLIVIGKDSFDYVLNHHQSDLITNGSLKVLDSLAIPSNLLRTRIKGKTPMIIFSEYCSTPARTAGSTDKAVFACVIKIDSDPEQFLKKIRVALKM